MVVTSPGANSQDANPLLDAQLATMIALMDILNILNI